MTDDMSIDKKESVKEGSDDSLASTPENEAGPSVPQENPPVKRKGGRKPIYATSEERKQRNRQAQAAFRERRTEYIKQLEDTIKVHESNLSNLQAAHRSAADECLMLRYKNSLLERILLEKGIDVQAELQAKTGSPNLGPTHSPQNMVQPPSLQRGILNRQHARRSGSSITPKIEPGIRPLPPPIGLQQPLLSPKTRQTPSSHTSSPVNPNPSLSVAVPISSPTSSDPTGLRPAMPAATRQQRVQHQPTSGPRPSAFYPPPSFQNHFQQLGKLTQQEYDAQNDMMDDTEPDSSGPQPYPSTFTGSHQPTMPMQSMTNAPPIQAGQSPVATGEQGGQAQGQGYPSMTQLLDPALDWDPFGLSASMAFPSQFSFDTSNMR